MVVLAVLGAGLAWLGITVLSVADGRRGIGLGLLVVSVGLGVGLIAAGVAPLGVAAVAAGGLGSAALRLAGRSSGWGILPSGSTPQLVGSVVVLIAVGLVVGTAVGTSQGLARLAALVVAVLAAGRLLAADQPPSLLGSGAALALALGALGGPSAMVAAGAVAAGLGLVDRGGVPEPVA